MKYEYTVGKSKNQRRIMLLLGIWWLVADIIGIFNADSRKTVFKFSGLRWFFLFEDLYNGQGSLQANKTSKKQKT